MFKTKQKKTFRMSSMHFPESLLFCNFFRKLLPLYRKLPSSLREILHFFGFFRKSLVFIGHNSQKAGLFKNVPSFPKRVRHVAQGRGHRMIPPQALNFRQLTETSRCGSCVIPAEHSEEGALWLLRPAGSPDAPFPSRFPAVLWTQ